MKEWIRKSVINNNTIISDENSLKHNLSQIDQLRIKTCDLLQRKSWYMTFYALKKKGEYDIALKAFVSNKESTKEKQ